jgi:hypothetical protein
MPNWLYNDIEITGPEADLNRFMAEFGESTWDFHKIIPQPPEVLQELAAQPSLDELRAGKKMPAQPPEGPLWYTWRNKNWGTKWEADDGYFGERTPEKITLGFKTANGVPDPIYRAIAARYPTLSIKVGYSDFPNCAGELHYHDCKVEHVDRYKEMILANPAFFAAPPERAKMLDALSSACSEAIKIIELEKSGVRDGDGGWHGGDVIGGMTRDLTDLCKQLMDEGWKRSNGSESSAEISSDDAPF